MSRYNDTWDEPGETDYLDDFNSGDGTPSFKARTHAAVLWVERQMRLERSAKLEARKVREQVATEAVKPS